MYLPEKYISEAHSPYKAAWSIENCQRKRPVDLCCEGRPDEIIRYCGGAVTQIVDNMPPADVWRREVVAGVGLLLNFSGLCLRLEQSKKTSFKNCTTLM